MCIRDSLDIPSSLIPLIELTWEDERHFHLVGRFDLAGGLDGQPIKLIEFNADTPSLIFEVAVVQWLLLRRNDLPEERQFNRLYETLKDSFMRIKDLAAGPGGAEQPIPWALFSCLNLDREDENTTRLLEEIAYEAGFITSFEFAEDVLIVERAWVGNSAGEPHEYWCKFIPYEIMAREEPDLVRMLTYLVRNQRVVLLNPPYTLLFQSKGILPILWELFPGHPLLLETSRRPLAGKPFVEKRTFGREGAAIRICDAQGRLRDETTGDYGHYQAVYQEFVPYPQDGEGRNYQAGVFFSYEPCGLGFRRDRGIINNLSPFVGHYVKP
ncbi:MAG: glutathionylspermidine synthase family protein, partial [Syntrophales bacterium]|nr:glutathionylspermidine synthase family protein [Syntrophales bacterium]